MKAALDVEDLERLSEMLIREMRQLSIPGRQVEMLRISMSPDIL